MKLKIAITLPLFLAAGLTVCAAANEVLSVAVFNFESKEEGVRDLGPKIATMINANLSVQPNLILVERAELEKVLGEHELSLSGNVSPDTAAKVGNLTGAKVLVTGSVFKMAAITSRGIWKRLTIPCRRATSRASPVRRRSRTTSLNRRRTTCAS